MRGEQQKWFFELESLWRIIDIYESLFGGIERRMEIWCCWVMVVIRLERCLNLGAWDLIGQYSLIFPQSLPPSLPNLP